MKTPALYFLLFALFCGLLGYLQPPLRAAQQVPRIAAFTASSPRLVSGEQLKLSWQLGGGAPADVQVVSASGAELPTGNALTLEPQLSETYTLVAENRRGSDQRTLEVEVLGRGVRLAGVPGGTPGINRAPRPNSTPNETPSNTPTPNRSQAAETPPTLSGGTASSTGGSTSGGAAREVTLPDGSFGVSARPDGPFISDEAGGIASLDDERIIRVAPGTEFYAEVNYRDPDGIAAVALNLVNGSPEGLAGTLNPRRPPFTLVGRPSGTCNLGQLPTAVRCRYRVRVAQNARNIGVLPGAGDEFAYVFRVRVTDGVGDYVNKAVRGYVAVRTRPQRAR